MSSDMLSLQHDVIPCWYELSFDPMKLAILVKLHRGIVGHLHPTRQCHFAQSYQEEFGFSSLDDDFMGTSFGFEGAFQKINEEGDYIVFSVSIPTLPKVVTKRCANCYTSGNTLFGKCSVCNGTLIENVMENCWDCNGNKTDYDGEMCKGCNGSAEKIKTEMDWHAFHAVSATFSLFFSLMYFGQEKGKMISSNRPQLLLVDTSISAEMNGAPIGGVYGIPLVNWLRTLPENTKILEVEDVMMRAYQKVHNKVHDLDRRDITATVRGDGWIYLGCPGDRTGVHPGLSRSIRPNEGYEFCCHNLDTSAQQVVLLAGLASLCDEARKHIKPLGSDQL